MHTSRGLNGAVFHYNSDMSGDVLVVVGDQKLSVPASDLVEFVLDWIARERITDIENSMALPIAERIRHPRT